MFLIGENPESARQWDGYSRWQGRGVVVDAGFEILLRPSLSSGIRWAAKEL